MYVNRLIRTLPALALVPFALACSGESPAGIDPPEPPIQGDAALGEAAFLAECASCHSARDGFDLAFFAFPDTTIVRRALGHVDTATANDITTYIRTVRALPTSRDLRIFQPGGFRISGDANFASNLFGADRWPADLTTEQLAQIDPLDVPIALDFPLWSFEFSNLDWMPEVPIAEPLLDYPTEVGVGRSYLESYYRTRSLEDLFYAVLALRIAERDPNNPDAPCVSEPYDRFRALDCFEARRWIATLVAQHMLRTNARGPIGSGAHDGWWDVGFAALESTRGMPIENAIRNWAVWMYVGWAFEPQRHASVYLGIALNALNLPRHATFHALRAQVVRPPRSSSPYADTFNATRFSLDLQRHAIRLPQPAGAARGGLPADGGRAARGGADAGGRDLHGRRGEARLRFRARRAGRVAGPDPLPAELSAGSAISPDGLLSRRRAAPR